MNRTEACPTREQLQSLILGELPEEVTLGISEHLERCSSCQTATQVFAAGDTFVSLIRKAGQRPLVATPPAVQRVFAVLQDRTKAEALSVAMSRTMLNEIDSAETRLKPQVAVIDDELTMLLSSVRPAESSDEIGRLSDFRLLKLIGHGGMGAVFLAEDLRLQRMVALKLVRVDIARQREGNERFLREARAAAKIKHENVVTIYQVGEENGTPFLAQELLEGETLEARLNRQSRFPVIDALKIGQQIAAGLAAAHANGLIHRDIKPANVFLAKAPHSQEAGELVKLLDFGLARVVSDSTQLTQTGLIVGTPAFMSPEQAGGETLDFRTDLFSLGCVLYLMLTGERPFDGGNVMKLLASLASHTPPSVKTVRPEVPAEFSVVIDQLLAKSASDRLASASEVAERFANLLSAQTQPPLPPILAGQLLSGKEPPKRGGNRFTLFGSAAAFLVLAAITITITNRDGTKTKVRVPEGSEIAISNEPDDPGEEPTNNAQAAAATNSGKITDFNAPEFQKWVKDVAALPAEKQVRAVVKKLQDLNPGFDGTVRPQIEDGRVTGLHFESDNVSDISPLRGFHALVSLTCGPSKNLSDLSPLKGMPLSTLYFDHTQVSDLTPLTGMPLTRLMCGSTQVSDLSPLKNMKLKVLDIQFTPVADLSPLKGMPLTNLNIDRTKVADLTPLEGIPLTGLNCSTEQIADLTPLKGMPLTTLSCSGTQVTDLSPLKEMKLTRLDIMSTQVADLSPLKGMPLSYLVIAGCRIADLSLLKGMPLTELHCFGPQASDLTPLIGMKLTFLVCQRAPVVDLSPLKGMPLWHLDISGCANVTDLSVLTGMPLKKLAFEFKPNRDTDIVRSVKTLEWINGKTVAEFWTEVAENEKNKKPLGFETPGFEQWVKEVAALSAEKQVQAVAKKMVELNAGFDGKLWGGRGEQLPAIENGVVTGIGFVSDNVTDLSPVRAFQKLKNLSCEGTSMDKGSLSDLSPIQGMPLSSLRCGYNQVSDLTPLKGMPLTSLTCECPLVSDLTPLQGMPLTTLQCGFTSVSDLSPLKNMKLTLLNLGRTPVADLSPLKGMPLTNLLVQQTKVTDLTPLEGMPLTTFVCVHTQVADLSPLKGMPLTSLDCSYTPVSDILPLNDMKLTSLTCYANQVEDLSPLRGMPLTTLLIGSPNLNDLTPLEGMPLTAFHCFQCRISDLSPLHGMPLTDLFIAKCEDVTDLTPLKGMSLKTLLIDGTRVSNLSPLRGMALVTISLTARNITQGFDVIRQMPRLRQIFPGAQGNKGFTPAEFWKRYDKGEFNPIVDFTGPAFQQWVNDLAPLPAEKQVEAVVKKLVELNPNFDGNVTGFGGTGTPKFELGEVTEIGFVSDNVIDLSPIRALQHLKSLSCNGTPNGQNRFSDFSPLSGMQITKLSCKWTHVTDLSPLHGLPLTTLGCEFTQIADLAPLRGMPLTSFHCGHSLVADLSPLKGMPLKHLSFEVTTVSDVSPLQGMPLENINLANTQVYDLSPLKGMPLRVMACGATKVSDLSPLAGTKLESFACNSTEVTDLSPLKGLPIWTLTLSDTKVRDLAPLKGMHIKNLNCNGTPITDLSPLAGMELAEFYFGDTDVLDLSPLDGMHLSDVCFTPANISNGLDSIRQMARLHQIHVGGKDIKVFAADEFWRKYDAGEFGKPITADKIKMRPRKPSDPVLPDHAEPYAVYRRGQLVSEHAFLPVYLPDDYIDGDVIEVRGNGPFKVPQIAMTDRGLNLRAGMGYHPVFEPVETLLHGHCWIEVSKGVLRLEGCEFRRMKNASMIVYAHGDSCEIVNCTLACGDSAHVPMAQFNCPTVRISDSLLIKGDAHASIELEAEVRELSVENSVYLNEAVKFFGFPASDQKRTIRLEHNTFVGNANNCLFWQTTKSPTPQRPLQAIVRNNVFVNDPTNLLASSYGALTLDEYRTQLTWQGEGNFAPKFLDQTVVEELAGPGNAGLTSAPQLRFQADRTWEPGLTVADRVEAIRQDVNSDLPERATEPGIDWDRLGPGAGYVRTLDPVEQNRQTPEPELEGGPFVVIHADAPAKGFAKLTDAVSASQDGDTVELRTNHGLVASVDPSIPGRRLTIRAARGYQPKFLDTNLLRLAQGHDWEFINLTLRGVLNLDGELYIRRLQNCAFEVRERTDPTGPFQLRFVGSAARNRSEVEVVNCVARQRIWISNTVRKVVIRNSVLQNCAIHPLGEGDTEIVLTGSVVLGSAGSETDFLFYTGDKQVSVTANRCLFDGRALNHESEKLTWAGDGNQFRLWRGDWLWQGGSRRATDLASWQKLWNSDANSTAAPSIHFDPQHWRLHSHGGAELPAAGVDFTKFRRPTPLR